MPVFKKLKSEYLVAIFAVFVVGIGAVAGEKLYPSRKTQLTDSRAAVPTLSQTTQTIEGTLQVIIQDDFKNKTAKEIYYLLSDVGGVKTSTKLNYSGTKILTSGSRIKVTGTMTSSGEMNVTDGGLTAVKTTLATQLTDTSIQMAAPSGDRKVAIVLLNWSNYTTTTPTRTDVETLFTSVEGFYANQSYNLLRLANTKVDIFGWGTMTLPYDCNTLMNWSLGNPLDGAVYTYLNSLGVNTSVYSHTIIVVPMQSGCNSTAVGSFNGTQVRVPTAMFRPSVLVHELGHNYGAKHAGDLYNCPTSSGVVSTSCSAVAQGSFDPMGGPKIDNSLPDSFSPFYKELFGWNTATNIQQTRVNGTYSIYPLESSPGNVQNLRICRDAYSYYSIENRTAFNGAYIRLVGTSSSGFPLGAYPDNNIWLMGALGKAVGSTLTDTTAGVSITVNSKTNNILSVSVQYPNGAPASCPAIFASSPTTPPIAVPSVTPASLPGSANVNVQIAGTSYGNYTIADKTEMPRQNYAGVDAGPVIISSTNGIPIVAALRELWKVNGVPSSSFQLMGLPESQLSTTYYFPAYNNITLSGQLRIGNVDPSATTTVTVTIGGVVRGTYTLGPNQSVRPTYNLDAGPVEVKSSGGVKIIAALRDAWLLNNVATSFTELMGLPKESLSDTYLLPAYNNMTLSGQLRIGNVDTISTMVTVKIAGAVAGTYNLGPSQSVRPTYNLDAGPVEVKSSNGAKIIVALRDAWAVNGVTKSFAQLMGLPKEKLADAYYWPSYDNLSLSGQLRFGNVDPSATTTVTVTIGGVVRGTYTLGPNQSVRPVFSLNTGPVEVKSSGGVKIIAAIRDAWATSGTTTSFTQTMGLPASLLSTRYYFPAYNNATLDTQLRIGNP